MTMIATNKLTAIVGLGSTGLSVARFLKSRGERFVIFDTRETPPGINEFLAEFVDHKPVLGNIKSKDFIDFAQLIVSPGISIADPMFDDARQHGVDIIGDIDLFARHANAPIVAITGSNGKTTVTTLVGEMATAGGLKVHVGGNIGIPALDLLSKEKPDFYILELSSFQLETTKILNAHAAAVLNVSRDHLDRYDNFMGYHAAKMRIYFGAKNRVVNREDVLTQGPITEGVKQYSFGLNKPDFNQFGISESQGERFLSEGSHFWLNTKALKIAGLHNAANALAAMALVKTMGVLNEQSIEALKSFTGLDHRCQVVKEVAGVKYINDSKATNVGATLAAVKGLLPELSNESKLIVILGGQGKGADFKELLPIVIPQVKAFILIGEDADKISAALRLGYSSDQDFSQSVTKQDSLESAVIYASKIAKTGDCVLLSPACASFDMFSGYHHRGQVFATAVEALDD